MNNDLSAPGGEEIPLLELLDIEQLQRLMDSFCEAVGIALAILDLKGKVLVAARWKRICTDFHRVDARTCARCLESDTQLASGLLRGESSTLYRCRNGLTDCASPVIINGRHVANVFAGQFLLAPPDVDFFRGQALQFGFDPDAYLKALREVPIVPEDKIEPILGFLSGFAALVGSLSLDRLEARRQAAKAERSRQELREAHDLLELRVEERTRELSREIEGRKRIEEALRKERDFAHSLINTAQVIILVLDDEGRIVSFNPYMEALSGYSMEEMAGRDWFSNFLVVEDHEAVRALFKKAVSDIQTRGNVSPILTRSGEVRQIEWYDKTLKDGDGKVIGLLAVGRDISERLQADEALRLATLRAESASRAKTEFLAVMSHEIRTPMNVVIGMSDVLLESGLSAEQRRHVQLMQHAGNTLLDLIDDILDLSKMEAGRMTVSLVPFSLRRLVEESCAVMAHRAAQKGLGFSFRVAEELPGTVMGDGARLRQVLINLIGNAVKFTDEGTISVAVSTAGEGVCRFTISDTGVGIAPEHLDLIFEIFTQADASISRRFGGTGLGLAISKRLVVMMGGEIRAESRLGSGSTFMFTLPLPQAKGAASVEPEERPAPPVAGGRPARILLVEDSEDNRQLMQTYLRSTDHRLEVASDGEEGVAKFKAASFDLVLMDIQMPVLDGYQATRAIRDWERAQGVARTPVLALTAHALEGDAQSSVAAGCDAHLTKPIKKASLLEAIARYAVARDERPAPSP